ncbi:MAG: formylglycine-generating enzyme family protein [Proteobacteria bacterium]|nr:formylglycine-generating enzyme family protein [Pseudomonadota bacterium]
MSAASPYSGLDLNGLHQLLRTHGMERGPDDWQAVHDLLLKLASENRLPAQPQDLQPLLGPLLCRSPQEQARFPHLFRQWLTGRETLSKAHQATAPDVTPLLQLRQRLARFDRHWLTGLGMVLLVLAAIAWARIHWPPDIPIVDTKPPDPIQTVPDPGPAPSRPTVPITDWTPPNRLPEPQRLPTSWQTARRWSGDGLISLPWLVAAYFIARRYRRETIARRAAFHGDDLLNRLDLSTPLQAHFGGDGTETALRGLSPSRWQATCRLDVEATAEATAHHAGYFVPRYRTRRQASVYLMLVRSDHSRDQRAQLAEQLAGRFREAGLEVEGFRFRDDPSLLTPWPNKDGRRVSLAQLAGRHADAKLIVISDGGILFHPLSGHPKPWLQGFAPWPKRVWLSFGDTDAIDAQLLWREGFQFLPLSTANLKPLAAWLAADDTAKPVELKPRFDPLPPGIAEHREGWLKPHAPHGASVDALCRELADYLQADGLLLLQTLAAYPEIRWNLTQVVDFLLFKESPAGQPGQREIRLGRMLRLPWLRHAYLPDYLREAILRRAGDATLDKITATWAALLQRRTDRPQPGDLSLDLATPSKRGLRRLLRDLRETGRAGTLEDPIFVHILRGGKLGLLDFRLPRAVARLFSLGRGRWDLRPAALALALALLASLGLMKGWSEWGSPLLTSYWHRQIQAENGRWPVNVRYTKDTATLAGALRDDSLADEGFKVNLNPDATPPVEAGNRLTYPPAAEAVAQRLAGHLRHTTYGATVKLEPEPGISGITVDLAHTYQPLAALNDTLAYPDDRKPAEVRQTDSINIPAKEPEMITLNPGSFLMGSPPDEPGRSSDEGPQHKVTITRPFAMGRYEVTFDEYDAFARDTGRKLPDDRGWGRGNQPVINVTWQDASDYAAWLSQQTGKTYRLPTEAEWEFAARAGTTTAYWWGPDIGKNRANCNGCGSQWDNKQTAPTGSFPANPWGLQDTAGNVWEWTADCWHDSYANATADGSAWLDAGGGDCTRRVVRGGSWYYVPQNLRSAFRDRDATGVADDLLGFRLARAL